MNTNLKLAFQAQVPVFFTFQVLTKDWPGVMLVPSGMVTSASQSELQAEGVSPPLGGKPSVDVGESAPVGVDEAGAGVTVGGTGVA